MSAASEWSRCRPWIEAAIANSPGLETIEDVMRLVEEGKYQFWAGEGCATITEIAIFSRHKALIVVHGGGDLSELLGPLEEAMCEYARKMGCDMIMGTGREGWKRVCERHGYRFGYLVMVKNLEN